MELTQLGAKTAIPASPSEALLEAIPWSGDDIVTRFSCPEFTSLCPVTGQPDFARIIIDIYPKHALVESKSLKLFLHSFRNHACFHEQVTSEIAGRIMLAIDPYWMRVSALFFPRGGIPIDVFWQTSQPPAHIYIPPIDANTYRGR